MDNTTLIAIASIVTSGITMALGLSGPQLAKGELSRQR